MNRDDSDRLVRVETKADAILSHLADLETRVRVVESFKVRALATLAVVWAIVQAGGTMLWESLKGKS